jgi:hypothetical protein
VGRFFRGHDLTIKKSLYAAERQRADVARARRRWIREQGLLDPARLVFIDETARMAASSAAAVIERIGAGNESADRHKTICRLEPDDAAIRSGYAHPPYQAAISFGIRTKL